MTGVILFVSLAVLLLLSVPVGISIGLATLMAIVASGTLSIEFVAKELVTAVDSFPLMAIPFFVLAGEIMGRGGISKRLFHLAQAVVGNKTGGIAIATVITCMFFAAISGSAPATVAAVGGIMIPAMVQQGYDKKFATALVASAGSLGVILPPSIPMVIYGVGGGVSVGDLFIAGILPGIVVAAVLVVYAYLFSKFKKVKGENEPASIKGILTALWQAKWALLIPILILGGIYGGIFTPTEAAVVAVIYGLLAGLLFYKEIKLSDLPSIFANASLTTGTVLIIIGAATAFGRLLAIEQLPNAIANSILSMSEQPIIVMLMLILFLLVIGCFMDTLAAIIIVTPILLPIATGVGYHPVHFGIILVVSLAIGFITPPLGVNLFVGAGISGLPISTLFRAAIPFFVVLVLALLIIAFIPALSLILVP